MALLGAGPLVGCGGRTIGPSNWSEPDAAAARDGGIAADAAPTGDQRLGEPCLDHADCAGGRCLNTGRNRVCSLECEFGFDAICPEGAGCWVPGDIAGYCLPHCSAAAPCPDGSTCGDQGICEPTTCGLEAPTGGVPGCCYADGDCADGFACYGSSCGDQVPGQCLPRPDWGQCWHDSDCWSHGLQRPYRCEGAQRIPFDCADSISAAGSPGTCVPAGGTVRCGANECAAATEFCLACGRGDAPSTLECVPRGAAEFPSDFFSAAFERGCEVASLGIECDQNADCGNDEACVFEGGEFGVAVCRPRGEATVGIACETSSECPESAPVCTTYDPFGYFAPFAWKLGWWPRGCDNP